MRCKTVQKRLPAYLERLLSVKAHDALEEHLSDCPTCRQELAIYQKTLELASRLEVEYPPPEAWENFLPRLYARIDAEEQRTSQLSRWRTWAHQPYLRATATLACLVLTALLVIQIKHYLNREQEVYLSPMEVISTTLINDVEARELRQLSEPVIMEDPLMLVTGALDDPPEPIQIELKFDLAVLEEALALPEDELWGSLVYRDQGQHIY